MVVRFMIPAGLEGQQFFEYAAPASFYSRNRLPHCGAICLYGYISKCTPLACYSQMIEGYQVNFVAVAQRKEGRKLILPLYNCRP